MAVRTGAGWPSPARSPRRSAPPPRRRLASITNATTGLSDATSVAPRRPCARRPPRYARPAWPRSSGCARPARSSILGCSGRRRPIRLRAAARSRAATPHRRQVAAAAAPQPGTPAYLQQAYDLASLSQTAGRRHDRSRSSTRSTIRMPSPTSPPTAAEFGLPACTTANGCFTKYDQNGGTNYPTTVEPPVGARDLARSRRRFRALPELPHRARRGQHRPAPPTSRAAQLEADKLGASVISDSWDRPPERPGQARNFPTSGDYTFPGITTVAASRRRGLPAAPTPTTSRRRSRASPRPAARRSSRRAPAAFRPSVRSPSPLGRVRAPGATWGDQAGLADRHRMHRPVLFGHLGGRRPRHRDAGLRLGRRRLGRRRWNQRGRSADRGLLRPARVGRPGPVVGVRERVAAQRSDRPARTAPALASIAYICNAGPGLRRSRPGSAASPARSPAAAPGIAGPGTNGGYTQTVTANSAQLQGGVYPNGADTTYWWEYGTTTAYGEQTPADRHRLGDHPGVGLRLAPGPLGPGRRTTTGWSRRTRSAPSTATTTR